jgi:glycosyltransferase involved in cell wall biosynthesis
VDSRKGYDNVLKLAELEEKVGFRSCFNFVPERYGKIALDLLVELRRRGFDIAVHGLKHDGKLFLTKHIFDRQAHRINEYLKQWNTEGFSSPSMHHNLEWLAGLNIKYSISTFDTDPFEPQPDGVGTIFPFWVRNSSPNHGFVEMPYTLPQDSTLFIMLKEKTIDIWKRKLDWVAQHGGMALLNTHSDYMNFGNRDSVELFYPPEHYVRFLDYIRTRYSGKFYHALPSVIAEFIKDQHKQAGIADILTIPRDHHEKFKPPGRNIPASISKASKIQRRALRVAMLTYSFYETDNRVRRYAETLVRRGDSVDVISLRRKGQGNYSELNGLRVFRVQERVRNEKGKWGYLSRIVKFFFRSAFLLTRQHVSRPYDIVHVHSVPDFEVFAALVPKLAGASVILDIHDIVPELYGSKFKVRKDSIFFKTLILAEKASTCFSDHTIISNDLWRQRLVSRSVSSEKCTSILNYPDDYLFRFKRRQPNREKIVLMYPGTLNHHQGLDIAVKAFGKIKDQAPDAEFQIYGDGPAKESLAGLIREHGLQGRVLLRDPVPLDQIAQIMAGADIGVVPKKNDEFGGEAFSTKTLEFMTIGVPLIVARTKIDRIYFDDSIVKFFEPGNVEALAAAMYELIRDQALRARLATNASVFAKRNRWAVKKHHYLNLVDGLCRNSSNGSRLHACGIEK